MNIVQVFVKSTTYDKIKTARNDVSTIKPSLTKSTFKRGESKMASSIIPKFCSVEGCKKTKYCRGWCENHYKKWIRNGTPLGKPPRKETCSLDDCQGKNYCRGLCDKHYQRLKNKGTLDLTTVKPEERFWLKVKKTENCWNWTGLVVNDYGQFSADGKKWRSHRYSYFLAHGVVPTLDILHSCDNPLCVNPDHLREGTAKENARDKVSRNRHPRLKGDECGASILTAEDVIEIKRLISEGVKQTIIAERFQVSTSTITAIKKKRNWAHLDC